MHGPLLDELDVHREFLVCLHFHGCLQRLANGCGRRIDAVPVRDAGNLDGIHTCVQLFRTDKAIGVGGVIANKDASLGTDLGLDARDGAAGTEIDGVQCDGREGVVFKDHFHASLISDLNVLRSGDSGVAIWRLGFRYDIPASIQPRHDDRAVRAGNVLANLSAFQRSDGDLHSGNRLAGGVNTHDFCGASSLHGKLEGGLETILQLHSSLHGCIQQGVVAGDDVPIRNDGNLQHIHAGGNLIGHDEARRIGDIGVDQVAVLLPNLDLDAGDRLAIRIHHVNGDTGQGRILEVHMRSGAAPHMDRLGAFVDGIANRSNQLGNGVEAVRQPAHHSQTVLAGTVLANHDAVRIALHLEAGTLQHQLGMQGVRLLDDQLSCLILEVDGLLLPNQNLNLGGNIHHGILVGREHLIDLVPAGEQVAHHDGAGNIGASVIHKNLVRHTDNLELTAHKVVSRVFILKDNHQTAVFVIPEIHVSVLAILDLDGLWAFVLCVSFGSLGLSDNVKALLQTSPYGFALGVGLKSTHKVAGVSVFQLKNGSGNGLAGLGIDLANDKGTQLNVLDHQMVVLACLDAVAVLLRPDIVALGSHGFLNHVETGSQRFGMDHTELISDVGADVGAVAVSGIVAEFELSAFQGIPGNLIDLGNMENGVGIVLQTEDGILALLHSSAMLSRIDGVPGRSLCLLHDVLTGFKHHAAAPAGLIGRQIANNLAGVGRNLIFSECQRILGDSIDLVDLNDGLRVVVDGNDGLLAFLNLNLVRRTVKHVAVWGLRLHNSVVSRLQGFCVDCTGSVSGVVLNQLIPCIPNFKDSAGKRQLCYGIHFVDSDALGGSVVEVQGCGGIFLDLDGLFLSVQDVPVRSLDLNDAVPAGTQAVGGSVTGDIGGQGLGNVAAHRTHLEGSAVQRLFRLLIPLGNRQGGILSILPGDLSGNEFLHLDVPGCGGADDVAVGGLRLSQNIPAGFDIRPAGDTVLASSLLGNQIASDGGQSELSASQSCAGLCIDLGDRHTAGLLVGNLQGVVLTGRNMDRANGIIQDISFGSLDFLHVNRVGRQLANPDKSGCVGNRLLADDSAVPAPDLELSALNALVGDLVILADVEVGIGGVAEHQSNDLAGFILAHLKSLRHGVNFITQRRHDLLHHITAGFQIRNAGIAVHAGSHLLDNCAARGANLKHSALQRSPGIGIQLQDVQHVLLVVLKGDGVSVVLIINGDRLRLLVQNVTVHSGNLLDGVGAKGQVLFHDNAVIIGGGLPRLLRQRRVRGNQEANVGDGLLGHGVDFADQQSALGLVVPLELNDGIVVRSDNNGPVVRLLVIAPVPVIRVCVAEGGTALIEFIGTIGNLLEQHVAFLICGQDAVSHISAFLGVVSLDAVKHKGGAAQKPVGFGILLDDLDITEGSVFEGKFGLILPKLQLLGLGVIPGGQLLIAVIAGSRIQLGDGDRPIQLILIRLIQEVSVLIVGNTNLTVFISGLLSRKAGAINDDTESRVRQTLTSLPINLDDKDFRVLGVRKHHLAHALPLVDLNDLPILVINQVAVRGRNLTSAKRPALGVVVLDELTIVIIGDMNITIAVRSEGAEGGAINGNLKNSTLQRILRTLFILPEFELRVLGIRKGECLQGFTLLQLGGLHVGVVDEISIRRNQLSDSNGPAGFALKEVVLLKEPTIGAVINHDFAAGVRSIGAKHFAVNHDFKQSACQRIVGAIGHLLNADVRILVVVKRDNVLKNRGIGSVHLNPLGCAGGEQVAVGGLDLADHIKTALGTLSILASPVDLAVTAGCLCCHQYAVAPDFKGGAGQGRTLRPLLNLHRMVRIVLENKQSGLRLNLVLDVIVEGQMGLAWVGTLLIPWRRRNFRNGIGSRRNIVLSARVSPLEMDNAQGISRLVKLLVPHNGIGGRIAGRIRDFLLKHLTPDQEGSAANGKLGASIQLFDDVVIT